MLTDSVVQEFRQGTLGTACLCSRLSGPPAGNTQGCGQNLLEVFSLTHLVVNVGCQLGPQLEPSTRTPLCGIPQVFSLCGLVWAPSKHGGWVPREQGGGVL